MYHQASPKDEKIHDSDDEPNKKKPKMKSIDTESSVATNLNSLMPNGNYNENDKLLHQQGLESIDYFDHKLKFVWYINTFLLLLFVTAYFAYYIFGSYYSYPYNRWSNKTVLPNLGASIDRAVFMALHITCGILSMFIGSVQFIKQIRNGPKNIFSKQLNTKEDKSDNDNDNEQPKRNCNCVNNCVLCLPFVLHRIFGFTYIGLSLLTSIGGIMFIILNNFETIGGLNMTISFGLCGIVWIIINLTGLNYIMHGNIIKHKECMLRSYAICVSSMMYRVWFGVALLFGYRTPRAYYDDICYSDGTCSDYLRPFEQFNAWWFWIGNLLFIEYVIRSNKYKEKFVTKLKINLKHKTIQFSICWRNILIDIIALWVLFSMVGILYLLL